MQNKILKQITEELTAIGEVLIKPTGGQYYALIETKVRIEKIQSLIKDYKTKPGNSGKC